MRRLVAAFFRLADCSAKQRRVERREKPTEPTARLRIVRLTTFDGDKSPHSKGFALGLAAALFKPAVSGTGLSPVSF